MIDLQIPPIVSCRRPGIVRRLTGLFPGVLALACVVGLGLLGRETGWRLPRFSALVGGGATVADDWCVEHAVPESQCVECNPGLLARPVAYGWCAVHGVHECPLCHPGVAQTPGPAEVSAEDRDRAARALAFAPRTANNKQCKLHQRRIQVASTELLSRLGIDVRSVARAPVTEFVDAPGEVVHDPTRVARLSARVPGTVWRVLGRVGDAVRAGEVLALVDAAAVGRAKSEFRAALVEEELRLRTLANLRESGGGVAERAVREAGAALEEARLRVLTAGQALANLGMPLEPTEARRLAPAELARRLRFLGLPDPIARSLHADAPDNLIALTSPLDGEIVARAAVVGEAADPARPLFTVADTRRLRVHLHVRLEDAGRLTPGQPVRFRHDGHPEGDAGAVVWVSPAADERTRTVLVRADLPNATGRHHANTFGTARIVLREEPRAVVVPSEAVHWEGDCHIVFVRDRDFDRPGAYPVFHVRKVRPGATAATSTGPVTEIVVGVLPGELVAAANSGVLRAELLKNHLGAG